MCFTGFKCTNQPQSKDCEEGEVESKETSKKEVLKSNVSVRPKKHKVTSQKDAISQLSATFENLQKAHEREDTFLQYQEKQAELNRQHELRMMEMMARLHRLLKTSHHLQQPMKPNQNAWVMHEPTFSTTLHKVR